MGKEQKSTTASSSLDPIVIRQVLEREIKSYCRSVERLSKRGALTTAGNDELIRQGISHALFVLTQECGV